MYQKPMLSSSLPNTFNKRGLMFQTAGFQPRKRTCLGDYSIRGSKSRVPISSYIHLISHLSPIHLRVLRRRYTCAFRGQQGAAFSHRGHGHTLSDSAKISIRKAGGLFNRSTPACRDICGRACVLVRRVLKRLFHVSPVKLSHGGYDLSPVREVRGNQA